MHVVHESISISLVVHIPNVFPGHAQLAFGLVVTWVTIYRHSDQISLVTYLLVCAVSRPTTETWDVNGIQYDTPAHVCILAVSHYLAVDCRSMYHLVSCLGSRECYK